jgi:hypothetical protein
MIADESATWNATASLNHPAKPNAMIWVLLPMAVYQAIGKPGALGWITAGALLLVGAALLLRLRWPVVWAVLALPMLVSTHDAVFVAAQGPQDAMADRDEAAEAASAAWLRGENPWAGTTMLGSQITTGPAAVLMLAPVVGAFGKIDVASFFFWIGFVGVLAACELRGASEWPLPLAVLYLLGYFDIYTTQYWALDELYFPMLLLACAAWMAHRGWWELVGAALALCVGWRLNYAFLVFGLAAWAIEGEHTDRRLRRMLQGGAIALVLVLGTVFTVIGRATLPAVPLSAGPGLPGLAGIWVAAPGFLRVVAGLVAASWALRLLRRLGLTHPFWHVASSAFIAHTLVWYSSHFRDYALMFVIPAFWALAYSDITWGSASEGRSIAGSRRSRRRQRQGKL